ncbi:MAG TPA: hypothetical protein VFE74_04280, partial [Ramlibacter sp.]|nr:hypothetical protein [Ramlibacter sp.]
MHTAICSFDDRPTAERAVERLVQSGFDRRDVHLEHEHATSEGRADATGGAGGLEPGVAPERGILKSYGAFFASLLGEDDAGQIDNYAGQVERGGFVVVVDGHDEGEALQAQALMRELRGGESRVLQRPEGRPRLRDILAGRASA